MASLCLLCYKDVLGVNLNDENNCSFQHAGEVLSQFTNCLKTDYFSEWNSQFLFHDNMGICQECKIILNKYCTLHMQLECIRLKQQWEMNNLTRAMKEAGYIPARIKTFREKFLQTGDDDRLQRIMEFRQKLYASCEKMATRRNAKVLLQRCENVHQSNVPSILSLPIKLESVDLDELALNESYKVPAKPDVESVSVKQEMQQELVEGNPPESDIINEDVTDDYSEHDNLLEENENSSYLELESTPISTEKTDANSPSSKRLRAKFKCNKCPRIFLSKEKLASHENSQVCLKNNIECSSEDETNDTGKPESAKKKRLRNQQKDYNIKEDKGDSSETTSESSDEDDKQKVQNCKTTEKVKQVKPEFHCTFKDCNLLFKREEKLQLHLKLHGDFTCNFCDFKTGMADILMDHECTNHSSSMEHGNSKLIKCSRCRKHHSTKKTLHTRRLCHFLGKHLGIDYSTGSKCPICGQGFATDRVERAIREHIKDMHDVSGRDPSEIFNCNICNAPFTSDAARATHLVRVHKLSNKECSTCHMKFNRQRQLDSHVKRFHNTISLESPETTVQSFKCPIPECGRMFAAKFSLECHTRKHKTEMFVCSICGKRLMNSEGLRQHEAKHKRLSKVALAPVELKACVVCDLCGKEFRAKDFWRARTRLRLHLQTKIHSGNKEDGQAESWHFSCELCGKLCQTSQKLDEHMRTHSKEQPFACKTCGRCFSIKYNLKRHMKIVHKQQVPLERKQRNC